ncbi:DUF3108 domain-containing protein [Lysobacter soyae]|uniref:DUF3108 domain-containing protein n=1 Tax=Lysobacter soyae TaxID=2764185 RepID=A0ABX8WP80_9GAMM|nr:DUF3108 domain-containing protein [Lysobacter sp. CJ11]QYR52601.1 DUF3108 domain-containing protein [Lysobacter sp. CJ11]
MKPLPARSMVAIAALCAGTGLAYAQQQAAPKDAVPVSSAPTTQTTPANPVVLEPEKQILVTGQPRALQGFQSNYQVYRKGSLAGTAMMQVVRLGPNRWRVDLGIRGTKGLAGFAALNSQQSTVFDQVGTRYVPVSQSTVLKTVLSSDKIVGTYNWQTQQARWTGDIKKSRQLPVALQPGDMNLLLVNLAVVRDARPGQALNYRLVDRGRAKPIHFLAAAAQETLKVGEDGFQALPVRRTGVSADESLTVWVSEGVPTPIRMLLVQDDVGELDLQLASYKVIQ